VLACAKQFIRATIYIISLPSLSHCISALEHKRGVYITKQTFSVSLFRRVSALREERITTTVGRRNNPLAASPQIHIEALVCLAGSIFLSARAQRLHLGVTATIALSVRRAFFDKASIYTLKKHWHSDGAACTHRVAISAEITSIAARRKPNGELVAR
jgi:hypothetical protein